ncbi:MAG: DUF2194 domain-containing protein [Pelolinea sp.]|nr:DUF2194 domain-containing protein [Pelolinea sp.]
MKKRNGFSWLLLPLSILIFLAFALFIERSGISYTVSQNPSSFLSPLPTITNTNIEGISAAKPKCLVLFDSESGLKKGSFDTVLATLESMKVPHTEINVSQSSRIRFEDYETVILTFVQLSRIDDQIDELLFWVENGGKLLFAIRPDNTAALSGIYPQLGITALGPGLIKANGVEFLTKLLPGTAGMQFGESFINHTSLPVDLDESVKLHLISSDILGLPILWQTELGNGKVVFINSDQFINKSSRGLIGAAYSLLQDVVIYPVINASVFYIDDFPAPIPEGKNDAIFRQFTRDIESFYLNVWWPDMQDIKDKYNLKYSTVIIETYEHKLEPPFEYTAGQEDLLKYYGGIVLRDGGEIGLHGFNHVPLCLEEDGINQVLDYPTWPSIRNMKQSVIELQQFGSSMFPEQPFTMYVPVSNILCPDARKWLPEILSDLKVIASVYLPYEDVPAYIQEFTEAEDGIVEFPRIVAGYDPDNFMQWTAANEIWLHYTAGHFVHPDDVLDSYRNQGSTWTGLRDALDKYLLWVYSSMPSVRNLTASEGAMAVQRFVRLSPDYECSNTQCNVTLSGFYDEGWLLMRTEKIPSEITNGAFTQVAPNLYLIEANAPDMLIGFEE